MRTVIGCFWSRWPTAALLTVLAAAPLGATAPWVRTSASRGDFPLSADRTPATLIAASAEPEVVRIAVAALATDIERVTGKRPVVAAGPSSTRGPLVLIGTLGQSPLIDRLVDDHELDVAGLRGAWESFAIVTTTLSLPEVRPALVIVGSDRRGTAYGAFELSQAIGVSPWHWWADVAPEHHDELYVAAGTRRFGPPSVKYRGIFINDEDWGLQPWAAKTFEPQNGGIGPKTYERVFELLLRLKANLLWPAMHACTKPFNSFPENAVLADRYAIVMGSSHAEPMLRDNVGEWKDRPERYNYVTNREGVRTYWEERVKTNGRYENIYTLGMRGVHDSGIQGAKTDAERIRILEQVFADQREMLRKFAGGARAPGGLQESSAASPMGTSGSTSEPMADPLAGARGHVADVPQMFCAYKEVLGLYRGGLKVPDDVTIVWPDDNFGYVRNFATAEEQKRSGGFGVYYHLSYLGAPMAYLWLYTTPPGLVWEEMTKAYAYGARTIWVANVGDLKPAEIGTEFFLQLAWNINQWDTGAQTEFLHAWAEREFGTANADEIAAIMGEYYRLNYQRKPEHLQWWLPKQSPRPSPFTRAEIDERLADFAQLRERVAAVESKLPPAQRTAFFELVAYPVRGSALANERYFWSELVTRRLVPPTPDWAVLLARAQEADSRLQAQTRTYNEEIVGGKWRGLMNVEPADDDWKSFRLSRWVAPKVEPVLTRDWQPAAADADSNVILSIDAGQFSARHDAADARWTSIAGLGRSGDAITVLPASIAFRNAAEPRDRAPSVDYPFQLGTPANLSGTFHLVPTQPIDPARGLRFAVGVDDDAPVEVVLPVRDGSPAWAQGVLNATLTVDAAVPVRQPGRHVLRVYGTDPGVALDKIVLHIGPVSPSYFGPPSHN